MTRSSLSNPQPLAVIEVEHPVVRYLQAFWQFSLYYGKFIATPVGQRKVLR